MVGTATLPAETVEKLKPETVMAVGRVTVWPATVMAWPAVKVWPWTMANMAAKAAIMLKLCILKVGWVGEVPEKEVVIVG